MTSSAARAVDDEHRDAVRVAHEEVVIGADVDGVPAIGSEHVVEQDAGVLAEVAALADIEGRARGMAAIIR